MRILALDHGTKRIGVAISDELKMIAQPIEFIPAEPIEGVWLRLQANRVMIEANVRRDKRKEKVDAMAAAVLLQSFLDVQS